MVNLTAGPTRVDLATRRVLLEDYLQQGVGVSLDDLSNHEGRLLGGNEKLEQLTAAIPALTREIADLIAGDPDEILHAEFSLQNGTLVDTASVNSLTIEQKLFLLANERGLAVHPKTEDEISLQDAMFAYNRSVMNGSGPAINAFSIVIGQRSHVSVEGSNESVADGVSLRPEDSTGVAGERGAISVEGDFASGEKLRGMSGMIKSWFTEAFNDVTQAVVGDLLNLHAAEHGDVADYDHEVVLEVNAITGITTNIRSEEADRATRNDVDQMATRMSETITSFVKEELSTQRNQKDAGQLLIRPIKFSIDENGIITADTEAIEDRDLAKLVNEIIDAMNERMKSEEEEVLMTELPVELLPALDLLRKIRGQMGRFHDDDLRTASVTIGGQALRAEESW